ncbi:MAG: DNA polymerase III subunit delta [Candidatus Rokubacteria bacterium]|nr:DNA polymerase III subunit delta [Candidatus Rokubacteria bacterium]
MDLTAFLRQVEGGTVPRLALLHGTDIQALDDALAAVTRALFPDPALVTLGRDVFDGRETSADAIALAADTLPLGVGTRLVVVRHCQALNEHGMDSLRAYVERPAPTTCLMLLADQLLSGERERKAHWLLEAVPAAAVVTLVPLKGTTLREWLRRRAAAEGYTVTDEAAKLLVEWVGDDPISVLAEVRKAALAGGPDNVAVGTKEVTAVVGEQRVNGIFDLTRAVERRDMGAALTTLDSLLDTVEPLAVMTLLTRSLRHTWSAREWSARGQPPEQIARMLRVPPFVAKILVERGRGSAGERLPRQLARCWETERRLKSSGEPRAELTALVAELCAGA